MKKIATSIVCAVAVLWCASIAAQEEAPSWRSSDPAELPRVFSVQIRVSDLDRSEKFYRDVFGAQITRVHDRERVAQFSSGVGVVMVQGEPRAADEPLPQGAGGFLMEVVDLQGVLDRLEAAGGTLKFAHMGPSPEEETAETSDQNADQDAPQDAAAQAIAAGLKAALITDPDGVNIEVIQFPPQQ